MLLLSVECDVIVLLCESGYCTVLNVVVEDMFMEVAVRAVIELWDAIFARAYFHILNARQREHFLPLISAIG
jgi:hypothetical protein